MHWISVRFYELGDQAVKSISSWKEMKMNVKIKNYEILRILKICMNLLYHNSEYLLKQ